MVGVVVAGGDHDDRDLAGCADHRDQGQALHVGEPEVEQDDLGPLLEHQLEPGHAALGDRTTAWPRSVMLRCTAARIAGSSSITTMALMRRR